MKTFQAVRAFIFCDNRALIIRESQEYGGNLAGRFDLPGGKIDEGEDPVEALKREVLEEVGIEVDVEKPFFVGSWSPTVKGEQIEITGTYYLCEALSDKIILSSDHDRYEWIDPEGYGNYDLAAPNPEAFQAYLELTQTLR